MSSQEQLSQIKLEFKKEKERIENEFNEKVEEVKNSLNEANQKEKDHLNKNIHDLQTKLDSLNKEKASSDREIEKLNHLMSKAKLLKAEYQKVLQQRDETIDKFEKFKIEIEMKYEKEKQKLQQQFTDQLSLQKQQNSVIERKVSLNQIEDSNNNENQKDKTKEKYLQSILINFFEQDESAQLQLIPVILNVAGCQSDEIRRILQVIENKKKNSLISKALNLF